MKTLPYLLFVCIVLVACGDPSPSNPSEEPIAPAEDSITKEIFTPSEDKDPPCLAKDASLPNNWLHDATNHRLVAILADETTADAEYGPSHRILEVYETDPCKRLHRTELPPLSSPDLAYTLSKPTYNATSNLVAFSGEKTVYCYDLQAFKLLPPLQPAFKNQRIMEDAQSGDIEHLEVWESFIIGYAKDQGFFAFNLSTPSEGKQILPYAETANEQGEYLSLFVLPSQRAGFVQIIQPQYRNNTLEINPLFPKPQNIELQKTQDENLIIYRSVAENNLQAYRLRDRKKIAVPNTLAGQQPEEIQKQLDKKN